MLRSTATLSCIGRRQAYFRDEFLSALEILHRGDLKPEQLIGSWAGAFGPTQFMPTSFKRYAVDFDGDGRRDVVSSAADLIASTANNLKKDGWVPSETWGYEVVVPKGFNYLLADRSKQLTLAEWEAHGIKRAGSKPFPHPHEKAYLLVPAGNQGPGFLMLHNFRVIMKYNPAEAYALAIGHLADRLRGGEPFVQPWPRHEPVLSREERRELQELLNRKGFDTGEPNGRLGAKARAAVRDYQASVGLVPDGFASATILARLRGANQAPAIRLTISRELTTDSGAAALDRAPEAHPSVDAVMAAKGQFLQRFGKRAGFGVAAVCGLALMTVPVLAQFGQFGGRRPVVRLVFQPILGAALPGRTLDRLQPRAFAEKARRSADRRQRAGAGRFHGRLAGLWTGGRARRSARSGRRAQEPRQQRPDPLRQPQRESRIGRR